MYYKNGNILDIEPKHRSTPQVAKRSSNINSRVFSLIRDLVCKPADQCSSKET